MNFIEASQILKKYKEGIKIQVQLSSSGNVDPLLLYIKAAAALNGRILNISTLSFGTLGQSLLKPLPAETKEIILITPWDILPELDWRSGIPSNINDKDVLYHNAKKFVNRFSKRSCKLFYIQAPVPPIFVNPNDTVVLLNNLKLLMLEQGAVFLESKYFSLSNYLASGVPFAGAYMGDLANEMINAWLKPVLDSAKVLVTDLDNVLWSGLAAEDGPDGINCRSEGRGFRHFIYQGLLANLKKNGVLLAVVSRNDLEVAKAPILAGKTLLHESDFLEIMASYEPKSLHIKRLAQRLNIGIDSFVFVDDNPIEIAEVSSALPQIKCIQFPSHDDQLPNFLDQLAYFFKRSNVSAEDSQRTEMYRRRMEITEHLPLDDKGGDLRGFLSDLCMELVIYDRSKGDRDRAIQLINKTNQFNLNGIRISDEEVMGIIEKGGKLFTAKLDDRTGTHGEILSCLIDKNGLVQSFVLSCRVFQRQIEFAFVCKVIDIFQGDLKFEFKKTEKNTPIVNFLEDQSFEKNEDYILLNKASFLKQHKSKLELFNIKQVGFE